MEILACSFAIGIVAGLRTMTAPAVVALAANIGWLGVEGSWAAFMASRPAAVVWCALALLEDYNDKLAKTPSRKAPAPFAARLVLGAFSGAVVAAGGGSPAATGALLGAAGAVAGTLGGYKARTGLVAASHRPDYQIALLEDAVAAGGGLLIAFAAR